MRDARPPANHDPDRTCDPANPFAQTTTKDTETPDIDAPLTDAERTLVRLLAEVAVELHLAEEETK
jgi:hypothetical protein